MYVYILYEYILDFVLRICKAEFNNAELCKTKAKAERANWSKYSGYVAFGIYDYCRKANICLQHIKTTVKRIRNYIFVRVDIQMNGLWLDRRIYAQINIRVYRMSLCLDILACVGL